MKSSDIRVESLLKIYSEISQNPGRKRDYLYQSILKMIEQGFLSPGDRLPTDSELTKLLPLSVATVQASMKMLADQKIVTRKQKNGTFISTDENITRDFVFFRFVNKKTNLTEQNVEHRSFQIQECDESGPWIDFLGKGKKCLCIYRDVDISGEFLVHSRVYLANPKLRILMDFDPNTLKDLAIRTLLHVRFGLPSTRIDWQVSIDEIPDEVCSHLNVNTGTVGQMADVRVFTINDEPLLFHRMWIPPTTDWALRI